MNKIILTFAIVICAVVAAKAEDVRDQAVLNSKMVKAILSGLEEEQGLKCKIAVEEDGAKSIAYFVEDNMSKFSVVFLCDDGRSAVVTGVIGDGGQTQTETFKLTHAN